MNDITIPADKAYQWALAIRNNQRLAGLDELADLLDPPAPSLRDEVLEIQYGSEPPGRMADAVLVAVRSHVEGIQYDDIGGTAYLRRRDVLRLLGKND